MSQFILRAVPCFFFVMDYMARAVQAKHKMASFNYLQFNLEVVFFQTYGHTISYDSVSVPYLVQTIFTSLADAPGTNVPDGFMCPVTCNSDRAPTGSIQCKARLTMADLNRLRKWKRGKIPRSKWSKMD